MKKHKAALKRRDEKAKDARARLKKKSEDDAEFMRRVREEAKVGTAPQRAAPLGLGAGEHKRVR